MQAESNVDDATTVVLTPEQASYVHDALTSVFEDLPHHHSIVTREDFDELEAALAEKRRMLEAIEWGQPSGPVQLTAPEGFLRDLTTYFLGHGDDVDPRRYVEQLREDVRQREAALAILDQLEAR